MCLCRTRGSELTVIKSVFEGGEGSISGGSVERSSERFALGLLDVGLDDGDAGGDPLCVAMTAGGVVREGKVQAKGNAKTRLLVNGSRGIGRMKDQMVGMSGSYVGRLWKLSLHIISRMIEDQGGAVIPRLSLQPNSNLRRIPARCSLSPTTAQPARMMIVSI